MPQASDLERCNITVAFSCQDQGDFAHGFGASSQNGIKKNLGDVEVDKASVTGVGISAYALELCKGESLPIHTLVMASDTGFSGDPSLWVQNQTLTQKLDWQGSNEKPCFRSEYNFTIEELFSNATNNFEADMASDWPYSDFEDGPARGPYNLQGAMGGLIENQSFDPGHEYFSTGLHSAIDRDSETSLEIQCDRNSAIEPDLWLSIPSESLPLESRSRRSTRQSNMTTNRPCAQPKNHPCDRCPSAFGRAGDLRRHYRAHFPDRRTFHCRIEGCDRRGPRGFYRRDKFRDHQRQAHGSGIESEQVLLLEGFSTGINL